MLDESSRKAMVTWITQVQKTLGLSSDVVTIAMSYFDRYLSSGRGNSHAVLNNKCKFQLAAITCYYTAVKTYEPVVLGLDMLVQICRGTYTEDDIVEMEKDILYALEWKVAVHTALDFTRTLLELVEKHLPTCVSDDILSSCQKHMDFVITNLTLSCIQPSTVGICCLASSLSECDMLSVTQKQSIWNALSEKCHFDLMSSQVVSAQQCLLSQTSPSKLVIMGASYKSSRSVSSIVSPIGSGSSSPVCVSRTARQAWVESKKKINILLKVNTCQSMPYFFAMSWCIYLDLWENARPNKRKDANIMQDCMDISLVDGVQIGMNASKDEYINKKWLGIWCNGWKQDALVGLDMICVWLSAQV